MSSGSRSKLARCAMENSTRKRLDAVYAKWEKRGRGSRQQTERWHHRPVYSSRPPQHSSRYHPHKGRRRRLSPDSVLASLPGFVPSLGVDVAALHAATTKKYTSVSRCCDRCVPFSRNKFPSDSGGGVGLRNMLLIDKKKYSGFPGRVCAYLTHVFSNGGNNNLGDLRRETLQAKRVRDAIEFCANSAMENADGSAPVSYNAAVRQQEKRAASIIYSMSSGIYKTLVRICGWLLFWAFGKLFHHIHIQKSHIHMLHETQQRGIPIAFLPSHKSHMDYFIMTFVLFNMGIRIPRIASGDNLKLPIVSWLITRLGGFFIKRRLDSGNGKDILYRKCLHEYMVQVLHARENVEFFIEGSRSRSGKTCCPKAGLLSVLVDSVKEGVVEDIMIVPVSISYDKILEKNFVRHELMGGAKKPETFWNALKGARAMLTTNTGSVRVDFAQPFSLQEYLSCARVSDRSLLEVSRVSHNNSVANLMDYAQRRLITALSHHIAYDFTRCATMMSTNMVAFLLLTKHRKGVKLSDLVTSYQWLEQQAVSHGRAVAFTGDASEAVCYALHYLDHLVLLTPNNHETPRNRVVATPSEKMANGLMKEDHWVSPNLELPGVLELLHHGNQVSPLFTVEAAVACSVYSLLGEELRTGRSLEVYREEVIEEAVFLCQLLAREFIFAPPCVDLWSALMEALESLTNAEILKVPEAVSLSRGGRQLSRPVHDSDEEEEGEEEALQVSTDKRALDHLMFLQSILNPFMEAYWSTATALAKLDTDTVEESQFLRQLQQSLLEKDKKGLLNNVESCSMDTLRNAVKTFADMEMVSYGNGGTLYCRDNNRLLELAETLTQFKR